MRKLHEIKADILRVLYESYSCGGTNATLELADLPKLIPAGPEGSFERALQALRREGLINYAEYLGPNGVADIHLTDIGIERLETNLEPTSKASVDTPTIAQHINVSGGNVQIGHGNQQSIIPNETGSKPTVSTAPLPDIRVVVGAGFPLESPADARLRILIRVSIENHSASDFFFSTLTFETDSSKVFVQPIGDAISRELIEAKTIRPGDSLAYHFSAAVLIGDSDKEGVQLACALVFDKINRQYRSAPEEMRQLIERIRTLLAK